MATDEEFYHPGDLIHSEAPFVHALYSEFRGRNCDRCTTGFTNLKRCASCNYVWYCGKKCQKEDWLDHKNECKYIESFFTQVGGSQDMEALTVVNDLIRLVARLVFRLKGKDWKLCKGNIGNATMSFEDLITHNEDRMKEPKSVLYNMEIMNKLKLCIGEENLPDQNDLFEIIGKVLHNSFAKEAECLYLGASLINHSCIPNAVHVLNKGNIEIRAIDKIPKGDISKVTISYHSVIHQGKELQDMFKSFYCPCFCVDCSLPYGESILSKIIDKTAAATVIDVSESFLKMNDEYTHQNKWKISPSAAESQLLKSQVTHILNLQNGVLEETNTLRIRVLYVKCVVWNRVSDIKMLIDSLTLAFGENSHEILLAYALLQKAHHRNANVSATMKCQAKISRLYKMHYGHDLQEQIIDQRERHGNMLRGPQFPVPSLKRGRSLF